MQTRKISAILSMLCEVGRNAPSNEELFDVVQGYRSESKETGAMLDKFMIAENRRLREGLKDAEKIQKQLRDLLDKLTEPPWHVGVFVGSTGTSDNHSRAIVSFNSSRRIVALGEDVTLDSYTPGNEVFLGNELNVLLGKSPLGIPRCGETGFFERYTTDGRIVLLCRDEEIVVEACGFLTDTLEPGDKVRFDKSLYMAFEKLERTEGREYLLNEIPTESKDQVGGQDENVDTLLSVLTRVLLAPDLARHYGLSGRMSVLMTGPPGCGKTLMARVAASEVTRLSGKRCKFGAVKPGEWLDPHVGVTEANIRNCFRALSEAGKEGLAILFLDEIESMGRIRGSYSGYHHDRFLATLLAELDGFSASARDGVAIIAATNRKDLIDPALLERLSDLEIQVSRPDLDGGRAIFGIHLPPDLPYSTNGSSAVATRGEMIETAVSRFYSPNAENELCLLHFRDGTTRTVAARELASGRIFEQVCRAARQTAFRRSVIQGTDGGLCLSDIDHAVANAMDRLRSTLTPRNVHAYLHDLPEGLDVVEVRPIIRKVKRPNDYLILNVA